AFPGIWRSECHADLRQTEDGEAIATNEFLYTGQEGSASKCCRAKRNSFVMRKCQRSLRFCGITAAGLVCLFAGLAGSKLDQKPAAPGTLKLLVLDETTKQPTPVRVEVVDKNG